MQRLLQYLIRPFWSFAFDHCRIDRETGKFLRAAGFESIQFERFRVPVPIVSLHIAGVAVKGKGPIPEHGVPPTLTHSLSGRTAQ